MGCSLLPLIPSLAAPSAVSLAALFGSSLYNQPLNPLPKQLALV